MTNPFTNPGFELGSLIGWSTDGALAMGADPHSGTYCSLVNLSGSGTKYISQSIDLTGIKNITAWVKRATAPSHTLNIYIDTDLIYTSSSVDNNYTKITSNDISYNGSHTVKFEAVNLQLQLDDVDVVWAPPVSQFSGTPLSSKTAPFTVQFTDLSTGNPTSWEWNFGDGGTSTEQNPSHEYADFGSYTVSLFTSSTAGDGNTETKSSYISSSEYLLSELKYTNMDIISKYGQIETCDVQYVNLTTNQASAYLGIDTPFFFNPIVVATTGTATMLFTGFVKRVTKQDNRPVWDVHCEGTASYLRDKYNGIDQVYYSTSATTIINDLIGVSTNGVWQTIYDIGTDTIPTLDYHVTAGSVLYHIVNIVNICGWEWSCYRQFTGSATDPTWGAFTFRVHKHLGTTSSATTLTNNSNIVNLDSKGNTDLVYTSILANGVSPSAANMYSVISANTDMMNALITNESLLSNTITSNATTIYLLDASGYPEKGCVQIDNEKIYYNTTTATSLGECTRGYLSTTATFHNIYSDVLMLSELDFNLADQYHDEVGTIWIGMEQIHYNERSSASMGDFTRGYNNTPKYAHQAGIFVRDGYYTDTSPATTSPVYLYGFRQNSISANGVTTQNGVDMLAQKALLKTKDQKSYGTATLKSTNRWLSPASLGSVITVIDKDNVSTTTRLLSLHYNQFKPITIEYGNIDELILDDFAKLSVANMNSMISNENVYKTSVTEVSTINSKLVKVTLPDGTQDWVELV